MSALDRLQNNLRITQESDGKYMGALLTTDLAKLIAVMEAVQTLLPLLAKYEGQGEGGVSEFDSVVWPFRNSLAALTKED